MFKKEKKKKGCFSSHENALTTIVSRWLSLLRESARTRYVEFRHAQTKDGDYQSSLFVSNRKEAYSGE